VYNNEGLHPRLAHDIAPRLRSSATLKLTLRVTIRYRENKIALVGDSMPGKRPHSLCHLSKLVTHIRQ
jgi:hypothetical protein